MCKAERLNSKILIGKMFEGGNSKSFSIFPIRVVYMPIEQGEAPATILISVSKRRFKRAVKRNRVNGRYAKSTGRTNCNCWTIFKAGGSVSQSPLSICRTSLLLLPNWKRK